jgi:hypothetical protein
MNFIINTDENLSIKFSYYCKNNVRLRNLLIIFEYIFHGVPWFLLCGILFWINEYNKALILFFGKILFHF